MFVCHRKSDLHDDENQLRASYDKSLIELEKKLQQELDNRKLELFEVKFCGFSCTVASVTCWTFTISLINKKLYILMSAWRLEQFGFNFSVLSNIFQEKDVKIRKLQDEIKRELEEEERRIMKDKEQQVK